mmetsp:Transcript_14161/g.36010  ORF Transcript_14161/g.36010 Transcript_14161/m.36010 type:complete len:298 (+) Transcript_14161:93-986(+)
MLSPLSTVQSNSRVTRSTRSGAKLATPVPAAKLGATPVLQSPNLSAQASPAPSPKLTPRAPPLTPMTPAAFIPRAPPPTPASPTPASPMMMEPTNTNAHAASLGNALGSVIEAPQPVEALEATQPAKSAPGTPGTPKESTPAKQDVLGAELALAMEDFALVDFDLSGATPQKTVEAAMPEVTMPSEDVESASIMQEDEEVEAEEEADMYDEDETSEEMEADDEMPEVTMRMKQYGMLPAGWSEEIANEGPIHTFFEAEESAGAFEAERQFDSSRAHGLFPAGALSSNTCSASHIRFE